MAEIKKKICYCCGKPQPVKGLMEHKKVCEAAHRGEDIKLVKAVLELDRLDDEALAAFESMLDSLDASERALSFKQRDWANKLVGDPGEYENLVSSGQVPRGREVPTPPVLLNRPLKPPGRK